MSTKAYSYLRFSTPEQQAGDSFRRQSTAAEDYAKKRGLDLDTKLTFHDLGVSAFRGKNAETGQLGNFLAAVRAGLVPAGSVLLVESLDRISRQSARKALRVLEEIVEEDITVVTLSDNREYTQKALDEDPMSLMMSLFVFIRANEESAMKSRRLRAAWDGKRLRVEEEPLTKLGPGWLELVDKEWRVIPERAQVVRRIFEDTIKGIGATAIVKRLNADQVPVFKDGQCWHISYIHKILRNPAVMGTYIPKVSEWVDGKRTRKPLEPVPGYFPAVVSEETFRRVQIAKLGTTSSQRGSNAHLAPVNIFGGLLVCSLCGGKMCRIGKTIKRGVTYRYLVCYAARYGQGCKYRSVRFESLQDSFVAQAQTWLNSAPAGAENPGLDEELKAVNAGIDAAQEAYSEFSKQYQKTFAAVTGEKAEEARRELERLKVRRAELAEMFDATSSPLVEKRVADLKASLKKSPLDVAEVNQLLKAVFSCIAVDPESGTAVFTWRHGGETPMWFAPPEE